MDPKIVENRSLAIEKIKDHIFNQQQSVSARFISKEYGFEIREIQKIFEQMKSDSKRYKSHDILIWTYTITGYADLKNTMYKVIEADEADIEEKKKKLVQVDSITIKSVRKLDVPKEYDFVAVPTGRYFKSNDLDRLKRSCTVAAEDLGFRSNLPRKYPLGKPSPSSSSSEENGKVGFRRRERKSRIRRRISSIKFGIAHRIVKKAMSIGKKQEKTKEA